MDQALLMLLSWLRTADTVDISICPSLLTSLMRLSAPDPRVVAPPMPLVLLTSSAGLFNLLNNLRTGWFIGISWRGSNFLLSSSAFSFNTSVNFFCRFCKKMKCSKNCFDWAILVVQDYPLKQQSLENLQDYFQESGNLFHFWKKHILIPMCVVFISRITKAVIKVTS